MKLEFEYGQGLLGAELPDSTDIFIPGETVADPPCLPQDWDSLYAATLESIRNPIGMPTLRELAHKGSTVVIVIPDIVKGGNQPTSHRKVAIRACLDELYAAGVEQKDVLHPPTACTPGPPWPRCRPSWAPSCSASLSHPTARSPATTARTTTTRVDLGQHRPGRPRDHEQARLPDADVGAHRPHPGQPLRRLLRRLGKHRATGISHWRRHLRPPRAPGDAPAGLRPVSTNRCGTSLTSRACGWRRRWARNSSAATPCWTQEPPDRDQFPAGPGRCSPCPEDGGQAYSTSIMEEAVDIIVFGMPTNFHYGNGMAPTPSR